MQGRAINMGAATVLFRVCLKGEWVNMCTIRFRVQGVEWGSESGDACSHVGEEVLCVVGR